MCRLKWNRPQHFNLKRIMQLGSSQPYFYFWLASLLLLPHPSQHGKEDENMWTTRSTSSNKQVVRSQCIWWEVASCVRSKLHSHFDTILKWIMQLARVITILFLRHLLFIGWLASPLLLLLHHNMLWKMRIWTTRYRRTSAQESVHLMTRCNLS